MSLPRDKIERLASRGPDGLTDADLLDIVAGHDGTGAKVLAEGGIASLAEWHVAEFVSRGTGPAGAARLAAALELGRRVASARAVPKDRIMTSRAVYDIYRPRLAHLTREVFIMVALDTRQRILGEVVVAQGSLTDCPVHPREAFRAVLRWPASGVIAVHNHPSSDPTPSRDDVVLTERLRSCADLLGIRFVDHIVIGDGYFSFCDGGMKLDAAPAALAAERR